MNFFPGDWVRCASLSDPHIDSEELVPRIPLVAIVVDVGPDTSGEDGDMILALVLAPGANDLELIVARDFVESIAGLPSPDVAGATLWLGDWQSHLVTRIAPLKLNVYGG